MPRQTVPASRLVMSAIHLPVLSLGVACLLAGCGGSRKRPSGLFLNQGGSEANVARGGPLLAHRVQIVSRHPQQQAQACARAYGSKSPNGAVCWAFRSRAAFRSGPACWDYMATSEDGKTVAVSRATVDAATCTYP